MAQRGIVFIGPMPEQMRKFGLKHTARRVAEENGMHLLPGTVLLANLAEALQAAERIGYPVMLKSAAGGGGMGDKEDSHRFEISVLRWAEGIYISYSQQPAWR
jgi:urea carboxylase